MEVTPPPGVRVTLTPCVGSPRALKSRILRAKPCPKQCFVHGRALAPSPPFKIQNISPIRSILDSKFWLSILSLK